MPNTETVHQL